MMATLIRHVFVVLSVGVALGIVDTQSPPAHADSGDAVIVIKYDDRKGTRPPYAVVCNDIHLATIYSNEYLAIELRPGKYTLQLRGPSYKGTPRDVEARPGEIHYFKAYNWGFLSPMWGPFVWDPLAKLISPEMVNPKVLAGRYEYRGTKMVKVRCAR